MKKLAFVLSIITSAAAFADVMPIQASSAKILAVLNTLQQSKALELLQVQTINTTMDRPDIVEVSLVDGSGKITNKRYVIQTNSQCKTATCPLMVSEDSLSHTN